MAVRNQEKAMTIRRVSKVLDSALTALTAAALIWMMLHITINALSRQFLNSPISGTNELVAYWYMPVVALIGFVTAHIRREHISVSLVVDRLPPRNQVEYFVFGRSPTAMLCLFLSWFGLSKAWETLETGRTAGQTAIILWPVSPRVPARSATWTAL